MTDRPLCATCRFLDHDGQRSHGNRRDHEGRQIWARPCRRHPITVAKWHDEWCGEHQLDRSRTTLLLTEEMQERNTVLHDLATQNGDQE